MSVTSEESRVEVSAWRKFRSLVCSMYSDESLSLSPETIRSAVDVDEDDAAVTFESVRRNLFELCWEFESLVDTCEKLLLLRRRLCVALATP